MLKRVGLLAGILDMAFSWALAGTTTTEYIYNADGAMTAMTVTTGGDTADTTFLTWDNFTPDQGDPATGTLAKANGRLLSIGAAPGGATQFRFDARDRLTGVSQSASSPDYAYHAGGMLRQSTLGNDALSFYYGTGAHPRVINMTQSANGKRSARLGAARFLSDGTEQVLLQPRKDKSAVLDTTAGTVSPYVYDPFGAQPESTLATAYDLAENPFQYAGEYRDPIWGGVNLRARWYHPDMPGFISRDPAQNLNRFAYAGGNPVMNIDPGGKNFFGGLEHFLQGATAKMTHGVGGYFAGFFLAPLIGPLAIAANPKAFWDGVKTNRDQMDVFLALGVVSEIAGGLMDEAAVSDVVSASRGKRWGLRSISDFTIGGGQSIAAGVSRGHHQFNWHSFGQGLSMTFGVALFTRGVEGFNVRSGYKEVTRSMIDDIHNNPGETLIFRMRASLPAQQRWISNLPIPMDSPLQDALGLGVYHEKLVAVSNSELGLYGSDEVNTTEMLQNGMFRRPHRYALDKTFLKIAGSAHSLELVGRVQNFDEQVFFSNPRDLPIFHQPDNYTISRDFPIQSGTNTYRVLTNNCHYHAYSILKAMGLR